MPAGGGDAWPIAATTIGTEVGEEVGVADVAVRSGYAATSTALREAVVVAEISSPSASAPTSTASGTSSGR